MFGLTTDIFIDPAFESTYTTKIFNQDIGPLEECFENRDEGLIIFTILPCAYRILV